MRDVQFAQVIRGKVFILGTILPPDVIQGADLYHAELSN